MSWTRAWTRSSGKRATVGYKANDDPVRRSRTVRGTEKALAKLVSDAAKGKVSAHQSETLAAYLDRWITDVERLRQSGTVNSYQSKCKKITSKLET